MEKNVKRVSCLVAMALLLLGNVAFAGLAVYVDPAKTQTMSAGSWAWNAHAAGGFSGSDVYAILGAEAYPTNGIADASFDSEGKIRVGFEGSNWWPGYVVYKFQTPANYVTTGGSVNVHMELWGTGADGLGCWTGVASALQYRSDLSDIENPDDFTKAFVQTTGGWGYYQTNAAIQVPTNVSEFYVMVANTATGNGAMRVDSLTVNATTALVPEPATLGLMISGIAAYFSRRRK